MMILLSELVFAWLELLFSSGNSVYVTVQLAPCSAALTIRDPVLPHVCYLSLSLM